jgi:isopenicillin-N epimerase
VPATSDERRAGLASLWALDPRISFLNHGSFGACPRAVLETQSRLRERMEQEPVRFLARELEGLLDEARAELARFLGADPAGLVFVPNATTGVNAVLRSLRIKAGGEFLTTDHVYDACRNALEDAAQRLGATVVVARVPFPIEGPEAVVSAILERVTPRTRLALIDHVTSPTALRFPVEELVPRLEGLGVATLVDGAHAPGMIPLDLDALGASFYTGNCHKWVCAPKGAAFLHVRRDLRDAIHPNVVSHGARSPRTDRARFLLEFDWTGTLDPTPYLCIPEALRFMGGLLPGGWPELTATNREGALEGRRVLARSLGVPLPCPDEMIGSLASLPLPDGAADALSPPLYLDPLQRALFDRHAIEVPVMPWPAPPRRLLRISAQIYRQPGAFETLARAVSELLHESGQGL